MTLFYVHVNAMGIALWKEQNNLVLKQVLCAFIIELNEGNNPCEKVTAKKNRFIESVDSFKPIFVTSLM